MGNERSEGEREAAKALDQFEPFSPTPEIWQAFEDYFNEITAKHGTEWTSLDVKVGKSDKIPHAAKVVVIRFELKKDPNDPNEQDKIEYALMPLDDNGYAFGFLPVKNEG